MEKFNDFKSILIQNIKDKEEYYYYPPCQQINYIINIGIYSEDLMESETFKKCEDGNYEELDEMIELYNKDEHEIMFR